MEEAQTAVPSSNGCFDCNICLDFATEPVVTLCGHLYCWPCIYKWLRHTSVHSGQCPVCKASLAQDSLVPLYGRGQTFNTSQNQSQIIPRRPKPHLETSTTQQSAVQNEYMSVSSPVMPSSPVIHSISGGVIGGMALAVMRNVGGEVPTFYTSPYQFVTVGRRRRQEMEVEKSLHQICVFLSVFALLCLLLF
ncbi:hypothetical protein LUZ60_016621 [Juncus effusus]|nr:hypothetical protein LUZ60_016621 [Juncus effusus]